MAPSTTTPSNLRRAPTACLRCRTAKVRCLVSRQLERCDRCIANNTDCVFARSKRARVERFTAPTRRVSGSQGRTQQQTPAQAPTSKPSIFHNADASHAPRDRPPVVTAEIRARILAALASLRGKKGAPFSFVTSGDTPSLSANGESTTHACETSHLQFTPHSKSNPPTLKLSWLLRPLGSGPRTQNGHNGGQHTSIVKMPSYVSSLSLGETITDPIHGGILTPATSSALYDHFMLEINAKWEYILDPHIDTHDDVRERSRLLFTTILFCSAKFAGYADGTLVSTPDAFLQTRLCSLARNLAVRALAEGDRCTETMQAFYLLACRKEPDDDISYLHSGYAFRILDMDLESTDGDTMQAIRRRRTWLALYRQDKQQSLFFMRRSSSGVGDEPRSVFVGNLGIWLNMAQVLPLDVVACCSADLRRTQSKLRVMVEKASVDMLPCLLDLMDSELRGWRSTWGSHLSGEGMPYASDDSLLEQKLVHPGKCLLTTIMGLWEHSVRLNIASTVLRQALTASLTQSVRSSGRDTTPPLSLDLPAMIEVLSTNVPGLSSSVEGAFGTLRHLLSISANDLRRSPDAVLLLGPNVALFLCLLLCLPCNGILGPSFQTTAVDLIRDLARYMRQSVVAPQDSVALHTTYLESLVDLLEPANPPRPTDMHEPLGPPISDLPQSPLDTETMQYDPSDLQAAYVLAETSGRFHGTEEDAGVMFDLPSVPEHDLNVQSLANLLDPGLFWDMLPPPDMQAG